MTVIEFPRPRVQLVERTGYPRWTALRAGGVRHRIFCVWTVGRHVYFEAMCGRTGSPAEGVERTCGHCSRRGWGDDA